MSGQNQTWKMGPISASQRLNGQWSGHIQSWALGDRSIENQLTHTRPGVTMAIDRRNKSCVCRYFIDEGFEMIHCLTHSIHLFLNLNLNSEWGVESMMTITSFPSLQTWCDWYRHKLPTFSLVLPYSFWSDRVTRYHGNTGLLAISVLMEEGEGRKGTLSWCREDGTWWGSQHYREQYLRLPAPHPTLFPDLISPDQTLSVPPMSQGLLIRHQVTVRAPLQELTRRQFVARVGTLP